MNSIAMILQTDYTTLVGYQEYVETLTRSLQERRSFQVSIIVDVCTTSQSSFDTSWSFAQGSPFRVSRDVWYVLSLRPWG